MTMKYTLVLQLLIFKMLLLRSTPSMMLFTSNYYFQFNLYYTLTLIPSLSLTYMIPPDVDNFKDLHKLNYFPDSERLRLKDKARKMFEFGYDNYMKYAFPQDELNPIHCKGRGPDHENPSNINVNDALGDYSLTLIDCLDTLAVLGNQSEFERAVDLVIKHVSFEKDNTVQVFEATIRVLGGLLAAHLLIIDPGKPFGNLYKGDYDNELLLLAHELGNRLLPAFRTNTGIPWPRVNLQHGVPENCSPETCTAGAGTLVLEFALLSHLLNDQTYENAARKGVDALWESRSNSTGLFGNIINVQTGEWIGPMSGLGAGLDSFYEYLLKTYIMFGDSEDLSRFRKIYQQIQQHHRKGRSLCNSGYGDVPMYVNVDMFTGKVTNTWIDALQAAFSGIQVLVGDLDEAICSHAIYYALWQKYGVLPERFNWQFKVPEVKFYPLRPELIESTYILYQATKHPFYLQVGANILNSLEIHTKSKCGYATVHNVEDKTLEDRMESFFLSETCKYLFLLFDIDNPVNKLASKYLFSTEGHIFPLDRDYHHQRSRSEDTKDYSYETSYFYRNNETVSKRQCKMPPKASFTKYPMADIYYRQIEKMVGLV